ncbi:hypothetical protein PoB_003397200 [Plakobranchus ocellatus]|uniref:Uncharacterized protein n=1 Tax=Plakobranchus ocellatus TaxID=259542 RepID=A0AAV4AKQ1_9GAST|nr:hypothetical protein PoB_003397200 [Plakobranchus ocellatus]
MQSVMLRLCFYDIELVNSGFLGFYGPEVACGGLELATENPYRFGASNKIEPWHKLDAGQSQTPALPPPSPHFFLRISHPLPSSPTPPTPLPAGLGTLCSSPLE